MIISLSKADGKKQKSSVPKKHLESLRGLLDAIPLPTFIKDAQSRFVVLNEKMCEFMGLPHEQLVGQTDYDFVPKEQSDLFQVIDRQVLNAGETIENEELLQRNGRPRALLTRKTRAYLPDGSPVIVACISDITELKQRETSWRLLFDQNPVPMWVYNRESLQFLAVNQAAIDCYGYSREQFLSMTALEIRQKEDIEKFRKVAENAGVSAYHASGAWRHVKADGSVMDVLPYSRTCVFEGRSAEIVAVNDVTELKRAEARIAQQATHDTLTGLPNRLEFTERLESYINEATVDQKPFAVLCLDLCRFKVVNDLFGPSAGDVLLKEVARRLNAAREDAFLARIGSDDFALLVSTSQDPSAALDTADGLEAALADVTEIGGQKLSVQVNIGMAFFPNDGVDAATILANADAALQRAKAGGAGVSCTFEPGVDKRLRQRRALERDLRTAISQKELQLFYQPQALVTGEIIGFEVLLRWHNAERGQISPDVFIPVAEESGLINSIGDWVLRQACREATAWKKPLQVAVNLSPVQFKGNELPTLVHQVLQETGLDPSRLVLEVTESVLFEDFAHATSTLEQLKSIGIKIALDDFGTGYSSLSYLHAFPFDKIKIDRSFVSQLEKTTGSAAIIRAVISLGLGLSMDITAEGVETDEQLGFLRKEGCHSLQGYLIGKPQPVEAYTHICGFDEV